MGPWGGGREGAEKPPLGGGGWWRVCFRRRPPLHTHLVPAQPLPHRLVQLRVAGAGGDEYVGVDVPGGSALAHVADGRRGAEGGGGQQLHFATPAAAPRIA